MLTDSAITYTNPEGTIIKTILYTFPSQKPSIRICYSGLNKKDRITNSYEGKRLTHSYLSKYDSLDHLIYECKKDFPSQKNSSETFYEYKDSFSKAHKITTESVFVKNHLEPKHLNLLIQHVYDDRNLKIKEMRRLTPDDTNPTITDYKYDSNRNLVSEIIFGMELVNTAEVPSTGNCVSQNEYPVEGTDLNYITGLIRGEIIKNRIYLTGDQCSTFSLQQHSPNKKSKLTIIRREPYWCEGQVAYFSFNSESKL